jgi:nucleotide-binding universal stress UspA family protein
MSAGAIVVAVDGSQASAAALEFAAARARDEARPLKGVFVLDTGWADYIGNDWQSARGARQGFLDYIRGQLEAQAEAARRQFAGATAALSGAEFAIVPGDPLQTLCELTASDDTALLVAGRDVFQVCGRPSVKRLARELPRRARAPVVIV